MPLAAALKRSTTMIRVHYTRGASIPPSDFRRYFRCLKSKVTTHTHTIQIVQDNSVTATITVKNRL